MRGGIRLLNTRHNLADAQRTEAGRRRRWEASRWFLQADGESGKWYRNETIRVTPEGKVSIKLPAPLPQLANAKHGRYTLAAKVTFPHLGQEWAADRVEANRAVVYRIHYDVDRGRGYLTASWQIPPAKTIPLEAALADGVIGVDTNAGHLAAWRLDRHGNPTGQSRQFFYVTGTAQHRDAQVWHALSRLLNWATTCGVKAIAVEDLDFQAEKIREKHGRKRPSASWSLACPPASSAPGSPPWPTQPAS